MKKLALCLTIIMALLVPGAVLATEPVEQGGMGSLPLVEMNGENYASISEAIEDINDSSTKTIKLLRNEENGAGFVVPEDFNIIIDFNGMTYNVTEPLVGSSGTESNGCQLLKNSTVVFKNGTFTSNTAKMLVQNYSNLTLQNMTLDATASAENSYVLSNNNGKVAIVGSTSIKGNKVAFDVCWAPNMGYPKGAQVTVNTTGTITGDIEIGTWGTINDSDKTNVLSELTIDNINHNGKIVITQDYLKGQLTVNNGAYTDLASAIAGIRDNSKTTTIKLLDNVKDGAGFVVPENSDIVIDFNGKTYNVTEPLVGSSGTESNGCQLLKNSTIEFKNGTFTSNTAKMLVQNYSNLTLQNMTLDATASAENSYVLSNNNGKVAIVGSTSIKGNKVAFDVCWAPNMGYPKGAQVTVDTTGTITGTIELGDWGTINDSDKENVKSTLTINNINHNGEITVKDYLKGQLTVSGGRYLNDVTEYLAVGLFCPQEDGMYVVRSSEEHTITVNGAEGGKIIVRLPETETEITKAVYGTVVELVVELEEGNKFKGFTGVEGIKEVAEYAYQFKMPETDVTISPVFEKLPVVEETTQDVVLPEDVHVADSEKVEEMLVETLKEVAKTNPELAKALENEDIKIEVHFDDTVEIPAEDKKEIEEAAKKEVADLKIAKYIDIVISVKNKENNEHLTNLEEVAEKITFTVEIPKDILDVKVADGYTRKYYIVRDHNGDIDVWEVEAKDGKLSFESDKFSTYAIAYKDVENSASAPADKENPSTGDNIVLYVVTLVVAVVGIASAVIIKKRNSLKK